MQFLRSRPQSLGIFAVRRVALAATPHLETYGFSKAALKRLQREDLVDRVDVALSQLQELGFDGVHYHSIFSP